MTTDTVMIGDLCRDWYDKEVRVAEQDCACCTLIAKGPGWTRHDGSSVNPVPGTECVVHGDMLWHTGKPSHTWAWDAVQFYRVTKAAPSQPPAPQPGWVATVTLTFVEAHPTFPCVAFPNGIVEEFPFDAISALDWSPPPPPPWEPEIGKEADWYGTPVTLRGVHGLVAWVERLGGIFETVSIANLRQPPKGGA